MNFYDFLTIWTLYLHGFLSLGNIFDQDIAAQWVRTMDYIRHYLNRVQVSRWSNSEDGKRQEVQVLK